MPEGPSIVILKEALQSFTGKKVGVAEGNAKIDFEKLQGLKILELKSWGKHFLISFNGFYIRIHLLMFGTYMVNQRKPSTTPRLRLSFKNDEINFYTCSVKLIEEDIDAAYDWDADIMNDTWNPEKALKKIKILKDDMLCDLLLNQELFSGVGNIIKNEVLFRIRLHPASLAGSVPTPKLKEMVKEARIYSFEFYEWKKAFVLKQHWLIYGKRKCPRCNIPSKAEHIGKGKRITYFCENCQKLYD